MATASSPLRGRGNSPVHDPPIPVRGRGGGTFDDDPAYQIKPENASLVLLHATGSVPLASLNPFLVKKVIDGCAGGNLLVVTC